MISVSILWEPSCGGSCLETSVTKEVPIKFVEGFYSPVSDIVARLKKAEEDGVKWSPEHAAAIQRFREFLDAEPESPPPTSYLTAGRFFLLTSRRLGVLPVSVSMTTTEQSVLLR